jgi:toxin ParE1/3/4
MSDLAQILDYTVDTWDERQAENYMEELAGCFQLLADSPRIGRACSQLATGLRRFEHGKHIIFYKPDRNAILIARILHQNRLPSRPNFME